MRRRCIAVLAATGAMASALVVAGCAATRGHEGGPRWRCSRELKRCALPGTPLSVAIDAGAWDVASARAGVLGLRHRRHAVQAFVYPRVRAGRRCAGASDRAIMAMAAAFREATVNRRTLRWDSLRPVTVVQASVSSQRSDAPLRYCSVAVARGGHCLRLDYVAPASRYASGLTAFNRLVSKHARVEDGACTRGPLLPSSTHDRDFDSY